MAKSLKSTPNLCHHVSQICSKAIEKAKREKLLGHSLLQDHTKAKGSNLHQVKEQLWQTPLLPLLGGNT